MPSERPQPRSSQIYQCLSNQQLFHLNEGDDGHDPLESEIVADEDGKDSKDGLTHLIVIIIIIMGIMKGLPTA